MLRVALTPYVCTGHVREGARDLIELPRRGAARQGDVCGGVPLCCHACRCVLTPSAGARGAIAGLGKGSASFAKSVGYGTFNSLAKVRVVVADVVLRARAF